MVVDTSAILAAVANEADCTRFRDAMHGAASMAMSSVSVLEIRIVLHSRDGAEAVSAFDRLLENFGAPIVPFDGELAAVAFDKGQGHQAQVNIIDCAACGLARFRRECAKTDTQSVL